MGLIAKVAQIDKKFSWSFLGFVLAAIFGGIAIYTEFIRDTSAVVKYDILSNTKILDVKEDVSGLSIIYNAEDIRRAHKTLSVVIVSVGNEGRSPILKSHYDSDSPLGLSINSGEIIKAEVIAATTEYLKKNVGIRVHNPSYVEFSQIIIEPNEFFTLKLLVLNPEESLLTVSPKGKIAGVRKLLVVDETSNQAKESFLMKVVSGSLWVQVVRVPTYLLVFGLLLYVIIAPSVYISNKVENGKKDRIIRKFKSQTDSAQNEMNMDIYEFYKEYDLTTLRRMKRALANNDQGFHKFLNKYKVFAAEEHETMESGAFVINHDATIPPRERIGISPVFLLKSMLRLGLISKSGESYTKNEGKIKAMNDFIRFAATKMP